MAPGNVRNRLVYVANIGANSITAYPTSASGNVRPVITLAGPHTQIDGPAAVAHDPQGRLFVACYTSSRIGRVLVFARGAYGDAAPVRSFRVAPYPNQGESVSLAPTSVAVDSNGYTYVGTEPTAFLGPGVVQVYAPAAQGAPAPLRLFGIGNVFSTREVAIDGAGEVYEIVSNDRGDSPAFAGKFSAYATGNVFLAEPPHETSWLDFYVANGVAVDPRSGNVYALNNDHITVFNAAFTKHVGYIGGSATGVDNASGIAVDGTGQIYVGTPLGFRKAPTNSVEIFAAGAHGNVAPSRTIAGPNTGLNVPSGLQ